MKLDFNVLSTEQDHIRTRDKQTVRQTDRQTDGRTDRQAGRQACRQADRQARRQADRQTDRQADRQTDRQTDKKECCHSQCVSSKLKLWKWCIRVNTWERSLRTT